jgi:hypothetical protein
LFADFDVHKAVPSGLLTLQGASSSMMPAPVAILRWPPVFQQAGCGAAADEHALLAHDPAHKHSSKSDIQEIFMKRN